jgi:LmbE family N-acetylglucosaminyl deacetylase
MKTIIGGIAATLDRIAPQVVYLPFGNDIHTDHQIVYKASISALKTFRRLTVQKIMAYETLSETEYAPMVLRESFMPNIFVDISDQIERKKEIFSLYSSEIMGAPFPRSLQSIESLAGFRGSRVCRSYSEAFMLLLEIA